MARYVALGFILLMQALLTIASGNIGCLFSETLCNQEKEWCFDDYAFGRCLPLYGQVREEDLYRYNLGTSELHLLEREMQRLFLLGYRWSHTYTQCVLQILLNTIRDGSDFDVSSCNADLDQDLEGALKAIEGEEIEHIDPNNLAIVRFMPSIINPHSDYADELYYPPPIEELLPSVKTIKGNEEGVSKAKEEKQKENLTNDKVDDISSEKSPTKDNSNGGLEDQDKDPYISIPPPPIASSFDQQNDRDYPLLDDYDYDMTLGFADNTIPQWKPYRKRTDFLGTSSLSSREQQGFISDTMLGKKNGKLNILRDLTRGPYQRTTEKKEEEDPMGLRHGVKNLDLIFGRSRFYNPQPVPQQYYRESSYYQRPLSPSSSHFPQFPSYNSKSDITIKNDDISQLPVIKLPDPMDYGSDALIPTYNKDFDADQNEPFSSGHMDRGNANKGGFQSPGSSIARFDRFGQPVPYDDYQQDFEDIDDFSPSLFQDDQPNKNNFRYEENSANRFRPGYQYSANPYEEIDDQAYYHELAAYPSYYAYPDYISPDYRDYYDTFYGDPAQKDEETVEGDYVYYPRQPWNLQRGERNDVKKPGPMYPQVSTATELPDVILERQETLKDNPKPGFLRGLPEKFISEPIREENEKKKITPDYVHIHTAEKFPTKKDGEQTFRVIASIIGLNTSFVQDIKVEDNKLIFQVKIPGWTAAFIAEKIDENRDLIKTKTDFTILQAGVGPKGSMTAVVYSSDNRMIAAVAIVCGVCSALLIVAAGLFLLRRHAASKAKLESLMSHDSEPTKDYEAICRARMAGKGDSNKEVTGGQTPSTHATGQRISSLSKESDNGDHNSPTSRSSTSSWCEEPVITNMDISTGHMVLSYMEDHLKNKDRLEQEWIDLCGYEAEPNTCNIALKPENARKNRYPEAVPYDHNRVILNEHTNVSGSNYINASSITDHDPRNPAYIATQGPLSSTAADFWQLVWEQGSVVIVMLTRLTENGQSLCHRYWPEEGSELYHIYEIHLVSEHIWCDQSIVRSFYLKNVKTGETRTVTQFHYLSWTDSGVPASTKSLLEFRRKVNKSYRGRCCPIIVHCSDGIGRTGTYCLIDMVLNRMAKGAKEIDIAATLEHIRDQRPSMVQTKSQFEFVLMTVAEEVHAILKALPQ